MSQNARALYTL